MRVRPLRTRPGDRGRPGDVGWPGDGCRPATWPERWQLAAWVRPSSSRLLAFDATGPSPRRRLETASATVAWRGCSRRWGAADVAPTTATGATSAAWVVDPLPRAAESDEASIIPSGFEFGWPAPAIPM